ncbi:MAG: phosphoglycerate kinase [bacterium]
MQFPRRTIDDLSEIDGKKILIRNDFNVPLDADKNVTDKTRLEAAEPTISYLLEKGAILVLMSHLGRPGGEVDPDLSLQPVVEPLGEILGAEVKFAGDTVGSGAREMLDNISAGEVGLLENLRFDPGEKSCGDDFSRQLAELADVYVNDAFGACHRAHASMAGVPKYLQPAVAGKLVAREYEVLTEVRDNPDRPFVALLGGAKVSDKLQVIEKLLSQAEQVLVGGAMAYTFMLARGGDVGESLVEEEFVDDARRILDNRDSYRGELVLPEDNVIVDASDPEGEVCVTGAGDFPQGFEGMDIGPKTREKFASYLQEAEMVFWNGPMGVFEMEQFAEGTEAVARALARINGRVIVGGGDSVSAINKLGLADEFYHVSTGGGASLTLVEGSELPAVSVLDER